MPFTIKKIGPPDKPYCVVKTVGDKRSFGCHATAEKAGKQLGALKHNVVEGSHKQFVESPWNQSSDRYAYSIKSPADFVDGKFALKDLGSDIRLVYGVLISDPTLFIPQQFLFKRLQFNLQKASAWLDAHGDDIRPMAFTGRLEARDLTWAEVELGLWDHMSQTLTKKDKEVEDDTEGCSECEGYGISLTSEGIESLMPTKLEIIDAGFRLYPSNSTDVSSGTKLSGTTELARERGVEHTHPYELVASIDEQGALVFDGHAGKASAGPEHGHHIRTIASNTSGLDFRIETDPSDSGDSHAHPIAIKLDKPMGPADESAAEADHEESIDMNAEAVDNIVAKLGARFEKYLEHNKADIKAKNIKKRIAERTKVMPFSARRQIASAVACRVTERGFGSMFYKDGAGIVSFENNDKCRSYPNSVFAFCSALSLPSAVIRRPIIQLTAEGLLRQEVVRTGFFVHPFYGPIDITLKKLQQIKRNFDMNVMGQGVPMNIAHDHSRGALAWAVRLEIEPKQFDVVLADGTFISQKGFSLISFSDPTPFGRQELIDLGKYAYTSAEIAWEMEDVERFESLVPVASLDKSEEDDDEDMHDDEEDDMHEDDDEDEDSEDDSEEDSDEEDDDEEESEDKMKMSKHGMKKMPMKDDMIEDDMHEDDMHKDKMSEGKKKKMKDKMKMSKHGMKKMPAKTDMPEDDMHEDEMSEEEKKKMKAKMESGVRLTHKSVLMGFAATNIPFIPRLEAIGSNMAASNEAIHEVSAIIGEYGSAEAAMVAIDAELKLRRML